MLGHRGVRALPSLRLRWRKREIPAENTLAAFDYALAQGCDGFEFDVRYTRDRRSCLHHDPEVMGAEISSSDHATLERLGCKLASLEDTLQRFSSTAWLDIELKTCGDEIAQVEALRACPPQRGYVVSSFLPEAILKLHEIDPSLPLGFLCDRAETLQLWSGFPITFLIPRYPLVSRVLIEEAHRCNVQVFTWTVNRCEDMLRLANWGVDGLISDDPKLLSETFRRENSSAE